MLSRTFWILGLGVALLGGPVQATPRGDSFGPGQRNADHDVLQLGSPEPGERLLGSDFSQLPLGLADRDLPPGLAKGLPPGLAKRDLSGLSKGDSFPPGLSGAGDRFPLEARPSMPDEFTHAMPEPSGLLIFTGGLLLARAVGGRRRI